MQLENRQKWSYDTRNMNIKNCGTDKVSLAIPTCIGNTEQIQILVELQAARINGNGSVKIIILTIVRELQVGFYIFINSQMSNEESTNTTQTNCHVGNG